MKNIYPIFLQTSRCFYVPAFAVKAILACCFLLSGFFVSAQSTVKTRVAGAANWSTSSTWIQLRTGTVAFTNGSTLVTGTGTSFTTELQVGDVLMLDGSPNTIRGTVAAIVNNTSLSLSSIATANASGAYGRQAVPASNDNVQVGHTALGAVAVTLDVNATVNTLTFTAMNAVNTLTHSGSNSLTITGDVTLNQPTGSVIMAWNINAGSATINGNLNYPGSATSTGRVIKTALTTGTLNITGDLVYTPVAGATAGMAVMDLSGGACTLNIQGSILLNGGGTGTLTPGTSSTVVINGTGAQNFTGASAISYNHITINKTSGTATMTGNVPMSGNLLLSQGALNTGNFDITIGGNWTNNGITFTAGTGTVTFNGTGAQSINGSVATRNYYNMVVAKTAGTVLSTSGAVTTINANNFTQTTGNYSAPATMNISGNLLISTGTYTAGSTTNVAGNWTQNVANGFVHNSGTVTFNGTSAQTIAGTQATSFNNATITNTSAFIAVNTSANVAGTLHLNGAATGITPGATAIFNNSAAAGTITGTGTIRVSRIASTPELVSQYKFSTYTFSNLTVEYNGAGPQTINAISYHNLSLSGSGLKTASGNQVVNGTLEVPSGITLEMGTNTLSGSLTGVSGTGIIKTQNTSSLPLPTGRNWTGTVEYNAAAGGQTIMAGTYNNLTNTNTSNVNTASGNIVVNGTLTLNTNSVFDMAGFTLSGTLSSVSGSGTLRTQNTSSAPLPSGKTWPGTVVYNNAAGGQTIVAGSYTTLTNSNTSGVNTAAGSFTVSGTFTMSAGGTIDMGTNALSTVGTLAGTGNIRTQNTSSLPIPSGKTWTGTVEYNNPTGGQTVVLGTYAGLIISNTSGTQTASGAVTLSLNGSMTIQAGGTLDMATFAIIGTSINTAGTGTLITKVTTTNPYPLPLNATWTFNVNYASTSSQFVVEGTYINLDISGGNRTLSNNGTILISGVFTPSSGTMTVNNSIVEFTGNNQNIPAMVYAVVTLSGGPKFFSAGSSTISGLTIQSPAILNFSGGTIYLNANSYVAGILNQTGGILLSSNELRVNNGGIINQSNGTIHLAAALGSNPSDNLKIDAGGTINQTGGTFAVKDYTSSPGTFNQNGASALFIVYHDFKPGANSVFYSTAGTVQFTGNGTPRFDLGSRQFNHIIINAGVEQKFSDRINYVIPISGNFTNHYVSQVNTDYSTFIFNGTSPQTIYSASTLSSFGNMVFDNPDHSVTITSDIGVAGGWTVNNNTPVIVGSNTVRFSGSLNYSINGTTAFAAIQLTATAGTYTMNADNSCTALTMDGSSISGGITHAGTSILSVSGDVTIYQPLGSSITKAWNINAGTATVGGSVNLSGSSSNTTSRVSKVNLTTGTLTINGNLVYNSSASAAPCAVVDMSIGSSTLNLKGSLLLTNGTGTLTTSTTSAVNFNGTGAQTINGGSAISYANLYVIKPSGIATLGNSFTVNNFFLNQGQLSGAGSNVMTVTGDWTNNGGTTINAPIVTFTGIGKFISGPGTTDFGPLTFANGTNYTMSNTNSCTSLSLPATSLNTTLTQTSTSNFTVNGNVTLNQPTTSSKTNNWSIGAGTATVTGNIAIGGINTTLTRIAKLSISTGTLNANGNVVFNSSVTAGTAATAVVDMSGGAGIMNLKGNLILTNGTGTLTPGLTSTVNFNGTSAQLVGFASQVKYNNLHVNNPSVVTLSGAVTSANISGNIRVQTGIFSNGGFSIAGAAGKTFEVANGATFRLTATSGMITGMTKVFGPTSTVEYTGAAQTVSAEAYGHLTLSGSSGAVVKTMPVTAFTVFGNLTSTVGTATSVSYTAGNAIAVNGNVTIGVSTTFIASNFTHLVDGNWENNGTYTAGSSTLVMTGNNKTIAGSSTNSFNDLTVTGNNINTTANFTIDGNLSTTGTGSFNQNGGIITLSGTAKSIAGSDIKLNDVLITGTLSTVSDLQVTGNLTVNSGGSFITTDGSIIMSGAAKTIINAGTLTLHNLSATGSITTASSFTISSYLDVTEGSLTASAGTITFTGNSTLDGTANLFNVTINGTTLQLESDAILGIANLFTKTAGDLDVTTTTPNTVVFNGSSNKTIATGTFHNLVFAANTNTASGALVINGDITMSATSTFIAGPYTHTVLGDWINNGTFTAGTSTIVFSGDDDAHVSGATTFNVVTVNNTASANVLRLLSDISVATINMTKGGVETGTKTLTITTTRTGNGIIMGTIRRTHTFITGTAYEFEGPNNTINFSSLSGVTSVTVKVTEGSVTDFPFGGSVNREYVITVPAGTYTASLRLHYERGELNGNSENSMVLWRYNGSNWATYGKTGFDSSQHYVYHDGMTDITGRWTFSDDNHVVRWNGSVSSNWATAANWTAVQGAPSTPPSINDIVQIGFINYTNAPVISTAATAKSISFGSFKASTLSLSAGGSLTTQGNIAGSWSGSATHTINVNNQTVNISGDLLLSDGNSGRAINLNIGTGTVSLTGSLTQSGGANIVFNDAGNINIGLNYNYTSGTFTRSTGTVTYQGTGAQVIAPVNYQNLTINKNSGIATLSSTATISGNLLVTKGEMNCNASSTVTGNVTIAPGAILRSAIITLTVGGNWSNSGTFSPSSGTVTMNTSAATTISASPFNNLTINKSAGTATLLGNLAIANNLAISTGTLDVSAFTANRNTVGGILTISSGANLLVGGANNFPSNYTTNSISSSSTVTFNGTAAQTVPVKTYGNLVFTNGGAAAKTMGGSFTANGNLTINNGATFAGAASTLTLGGNWTNNGTFTAATGTVRFTGAAKTISGYTAFNILTISGSTTVTGTDIATNGLFTVSTGGSFAGGAGTITVNNNFTNNGSFSSTGTVTFPGTGTQTIQFINAVTTSFNVANFNGTVSPVLSSTSAPTFNTLNINNTGGISPSIGWTVNTAFTVNSGATFTGGNATHNFYGSFTNNGTVNSAGTLNISPTTTQSIQLRGSNFTSTGTVIFGGSAATTITGVANTLTNVVIANTVGVSPAANWLVAGNFAINSAAIFNAGNYTYTVAGDIQSGGTLNGGTSVFTMTSAMGTLSGSNNTIFYDLVITGNIMVAADYKVSRNFTNNGTYDGSGGALIMTGATAATLSGSASPYTVAQLTIQKSGGATATLTKNVTAVSALVITSGILDAATFTISQDAVNGGSMDVQNGGTLKIGGTNALPTFATTTLGNSSTVEYYGSTQTITSVAPLGKTYGNLVISNAGTKTANGSLYIMGNLTVTTATFVPGAFTDTLSGNWSLASGTFTNTGNTLVLNGTENQSVNMAGTFNHLRIDKAAGNANLLSNVTIAGTLTFTSGKITTGSFNVITTSGTVTGAGQETGWVNGNFRRNFAPGTLTGAFPVGGVNNYTPFNLTFASISVGGAITGSSAGVHAQLATSGITLDKNLARTWTVTNTGGVTFTNYSISLNWNAAQNYPDFDSTLLKMSLYSSGSWSVPTVSGTPTSTNIIGSPINLFGDFIVGERCDVTGTFSYSAGAFCTNGANAAVTFAPGSSAGYFSSNPAGMSINSTTGLINVSTSVAKTYTVSNTVTGTGGCSSTSSYSVVIGAPPSATISYPGSAFCNNLSSGAVSRTGSGGGTYSSTAGITIHATTGAVTPLSSTPGTYTVTYTVPAANGCAQFQTTAPVSISGDGNWKGTTSTNWNTGANWECGTVPAAGTSILVKGGLTNYPVVSADTVVVNALTINSTAALTVTGSKIKIAGAISNSGTFNTSTGIVEFNGTSAQTIPANVFASNNVGELIINNTAGVTVAGQVNIIDFLTIRGGSINTGGFVTLKSSATNTAQIPQITSAASTPINGSVTVERFVPGRRKYRLITSSVNTSASSTLTVGQEALSIWGNWQMSGSTASQNVGTSITGGTVADGFDQLTTAASLYTYNDVTKKFVAHSSANGKNTKYTPLKAGVGYYMFVYGDRQNSASATSPRPTVLSAKGTINTGSQTFTTASAIPLSPVPDRFTLIGNPFPTMIDWKSVLKANVSQTIWGWDANLASTGGYVTVTATGGGAIVSPMSELVTITRYVQPGQAFFVKTTDVSPQIVIREADKAVNKTNINSYVFRGDSTQLQPLLAVNLLYASGGSTILADGIVAAFDNSFNNAATDEDGSKMAGTAESIAWKNDNELLAIDTRKIPQNDTLYVNSLRLTKPSYTLQVFAKDMGNLGLQLLLKDNFLKTELPLSLVDTNLIAFAITSDTASQSASRFSFIFKSNFLSLPVTFTSVKATRKEKDVQVEWSVATESGIKNYEVEKSVDGSRYTKVTEVNNVANNNSTANYSWLDVSPVSGNNYYRIRTEEVNGTINYSNVVSVNMTGKNAEIRISPNPVKGRMMNLYIQDLLKGSYTLNIINAQGRQVFNSRVIHDGGSQLQRIAIPAGLAAGYYHVQLSGDNAQLTQIMLVE